MCLAAPRACSRRHSSTRWREIRHEAGIDVVLFGTGYPEHLDRNIDSILSPPVPREDVDRLNALFGALQGIGLDRPSHWKPCGPA
jgi:hypothetical protein